MFQAYPYADCYKNRAASDEPGKIRIDGGLVVRGVIGLTGQYHPGKPKSAGLYDCVADREKWFADGLAQIGQLPGVESVAFPDHIGCGLAGGECEALWRESEASLACTMRSWWGVT